MWSPHTLKPIICGPNGYPFRLTFRWWIIHRYTPKVPLSHTPSLTENRALKHNHLTRVPERKEAAPPWSRTRDHPNTNGHRRVQYHEKKPMCVGGSQLGHNFQYKDCVWTLLVHHTQNDVAGLRCIPRFLVILYRSEIGWTCRTPLNVNRFIPIKPQGAYKSVESCSLPQRWPTVDRGRSFVSIKTDLPPR